MSEKEIVEVFVQVQEPKYYDRIMLLVGEKFAEIVKVGETIEDGLRIGKIARVAASPGSWGLLKKKREDVSSISYEGKKTPGKSSSYQRRSRPSQSSYPTCYAYDDYQNTPPFSYQNIPPPNYQNTPNLSYQNTPPLSYQTPPPIYQTPPHHYRNAAPNCANVQKNYQTSPLMYQTPAPLYQNTPTNYQAPQPNYQTNLYPRYQAPSPNSPNYLGPKPVDTSSKFYRPDQRGTYHSNGVGYDIEDCINLKHKIQDLIDQKVISLQTLVPNVNNNPLSNHGGVTINMIELDDDWCVTKAIVSIAPDELEKDVSSLNIREKKEFVILTPEKVVALVPREALAQTKVVIETAVTQGMTRSGRCYTPEELAQGVQKKDQSKRPISEAKAEEFWRKMQSKDYSIVKHLEKMSAQISVWVLLMSLQLHRGTPMRT
ncbi:hypothetical protein R3W88_033577 [Solanum pinnatisectum]|uniref:Uncharacterized protein n=1 Tax=Solanum pinnatisectum TaxID=50273 RepID=A0AAV9K2B4_9SOLN|nr:hypothetical protein R3W88_033577 [Solanum pinnatisectum]